MQVSWQAFVAAHGAGVGARFLARIVGQPEAAVRRARAASGPSGGTATSSVQKFPELFARWHGRPPQAADWPAPRRAGMGSYEWLPPEDAALASLVGRMDKAQLAAAMTARLRQLTGDRTAVRTAHSIQSRVNKMGLWITDAVGGITVNAAGTEIGSVEVVRNAIRNGSLRAFRVGKMLIIPNDSWQQWKSSRPIAPRGFVKLASIREALGISSDSKLCEFAKLGYVPTALQCNPARGDGGNTRWGCWYVDRKVARKLVADRHAGRPMPWHGKPLPINLRHSWNRWQERKHPADCTTCADIWGGAGAPSSFEDFCTRYPPLAHGAKRHLTMKWHEGITVAELARRSKRNAWQVTTAIENGMLRATRKGRNLFITRTDATRWIARKCPTGTSSKSWISLPTATRWYGFSRAELYAFVSAGQLVQRTGTDGPQYGVALVSRQQCAELRERIGYTEAQAAAKVGVTIAAFRELLAGVDWRGGDRIPLITIQAVIKRLQSKHGYTIEESAAAAKMSVAWVRARIRDGSVRVSRAPWDRRRLYLSGPMLERLKKAKRRKRGPAKLSEAWIRLREAAQLACVSTTTLQKWAAAGEVRTRTAPDGYLRYARVSVMSRARQYWRRWENRRAAPPAWISRSEVTRR